MVQSSFQRLFSKAEDLLRMTFEQLAPTVLKLAYEQRQQAGVIELCAEVGDGVKG